MMRLGWQAALGIGLGLALAALVVTLVPARYRTPEPTGAMLEEIPAEREAIRSVVLQYAAGSGFVLPVYRDFLRQLDPAVTVYLVCPDHAALAEWRTGISPVERAVRPVFTGHEMTAWARDRWVALTPARAGARTTLLYPRGEENADAWPARAGDAKIAGDLAGAFPKLLAARASALYFDGGDLLADASCVFVTPAVLMRNLQHTVVDVEGLKTVLRRETGREPVLLEGAPDHHAGMFMMAGGAVAGRKTMVVADPSLAKAVVPALAGGGNAGANGTAAAWLADLLGKLPGGPDFGPQTQGQFDAVARAAAGAGYKVARIPVVPAKEAKIYLTYVNVILDIRGGRKTVFMPTFAGAEELNAAAAKVWEGLGFEVKGINCTGVFEKGGTLHCLVNVMERG